MNNPYDAFWEGAHLTTGWEGAHLTTGRIPDIMSAVYVPSRYGMSATVPHEFIDIDYASVEARTVAMYMTHGHKRVLVALSDDIAVDREREAVKVLLDRCAEYIPLDLAKRSNLPGHKSGQPRNRKERRAQEAAYRNKR